MTDEKMPDETKKDFKGLLAEIALKGGELRGLVLQAGAAFAAASPEERVAFTKDKEVSQTVGATHAFISMFTSQHFTALVLQPFIALVMKESPFQGPEMLADAMADGMAWAAMTCTCGACAACKLKEARGLEIATVEIRTRLRATVGVNQMAMKGMGKA
jgi:hypothetical protein